MSKESVLVTGSSGLMGTAFMELLGTDPNYLLRPFKGDIRNKEDVVRNLRDIDTVVHFAALTFVPPSWENPFEYMNVIYDGTVNFLQNYRLFKKFIFISTSHTYGNQVQFPITLETDRLPNDPYSIAKKAADDAVRLYSSHFGFKALVVRPFNNFGPRQSVNFVVPTMILQALNKGRITLKGDSQKEFVYVKDTVRAIKGFIEKDITGMVHICKGEAYKLTDMARQILTLTGHEGSPVEILPTDRPTELDKLLGDPSSLYNVIPDFEFTDMIQALSETIGWYRDNR